MLLATVRSNHTAFSLFLENKEFLKVASHRDLIQFKFVPLRSAIDPKLDKVTTIARVDNYFFSKATKGQATKNIKNNNNKVGR